MIPYNIIVTQQRKIKSTYYYHNAFEPLYNHSSSKHQETNNKITFIDIMYSHFPYIKGYFC